MYQIHQVDSSNQDVMNLLHRFNSMEPSWPKLQQRHFDGYWWVVYLENEPVAFAGMVPMMPFPNIGYLKRCWVHPDHHGHGLQYRLMMARELKARQLGWTHLVSESSSEYSNNNFRKAGFEEFDPEQPWAENSAYWIKSLI